MFVFSDLQEPINTQHYGYSDIMSFLLTPLMPRFISQSPALWSQVFLLFYFVCVGYSVVLYNSSVEESRDPTLMADIPEDKQAWSQRDFPADNRYGSVKILSSVHTIMHR